jgi:divinyl protochlorophyllide a 8-vinyl-reductase
MTMSLAQPPRAEDAVDPSRPYGATVARIGPNAAIQLLRVLPLAAGPETVRRIVETAGVAGWLSDPPAEMVDERLAAALHRATRTILDPDESASVLRTAGALTGDYILANRIPKWARAILTILPARLSARLLAKAIAAHAWTFVGSGSFVCDWTDGLRLEIWSNPLCLGGRTHTPACAWHAAVFQRLFETLASRRTLVVETACCARGDPCCRFAVGGIR